MSNGRRLYPNICELKRARLQKLRQANYRCQWPGCKKEAYIVHHLDGSSDDHSDENLQVLCSMHHQKIHGIITRSFTSDNSADLHQITHVLKERGWSIFRLSKAAGLSPPTVSRALKGTGTLKSYRKISEALGMDFDIILPTKLVNYGEQ